MRQVVRFGVAVTVEGVPSRLLERALPPMSVKQRARAAAVVSVRRLDGEFAVEVDGDIVHRLATRAQAERFALGEIEHAVAARSPLAFVHAGVVGIDGRALVVPGASRSGKSTLVRALVEAGATYLSDEFAVLDRDGLVWPFARPLRMRTAVEGVQQTIPLPGETGPLPVGAVLFTAYGEAGELRPVSEGEAVLALLSFALSARTRPAGTLDALRASVAGAVALRGTRGEAAGLARRLVDSPPWLSWR